MKSIALPVIFIICLFCICGVVFSQTSSIWNGNSWSNGSPSDNELNPISYIVETNIPHNPPDDIAFLMESLTLENGTTFNLTADNSYGNILILDSLRIENNASLSVSIPITSDYLSVNTLRILPSGSFSINNNIKVKYNLYIGGSLTLISPSKFNLTGLNTLDIYNNQSYTLSNFISTSSLSISQLILNGSTFLTVDKKIDAATSITIGNGSYMLTGDTLITNTLNLNGSLRTFGSPIITITSLPPISGSLYLPSATFNYSNDTLSLIGNNSSLGYLNKPSNFEVTIRGTSDTIKNCNLSQLFLRPANSGIINNISPYKIGKIDASGQVNIASLPYTDTLLVESGGSYSINSKVHVNKLVNLTSGGSSGILVSNGNLIMEDGSNLLINGDGQITGNVEWDRFYNSSGWIYYGVPFNGITLGAIQSGSAAEIYINQYEEYSDGTPSRWVGVESVDGLNLGSGYIIAFQTGVNDTIKCLGQPQVDNVTVPVTYTTTNGSWFDYQEGYNLVANPYTAPINVNSFFSGNTGNYSVIYYWANTGGDSGKYISRTSSGVIESAPSNVTNISKSYLAPNQAFFVKTTSSAPSVNFNAGMISDTNQNNNYLESLKIPLYIRLNARNNSRINSDLVLLIDSAATKTYNSSLDVFKLISSTYPLEMYSLIDSNKFYIQAITPDTSKKVIPVGLIVQKNEPHTFYINDFTAINPEINVYLYDITTNRHVNLRDSSYTVNLSPGTYDNRFELVFNVGEWSGTNGISTGTLSLKNNRDIVTYSQQGQAYVNFIQPQQNITVQLYDILGRLVYSNNYESINGVVSLGTYNLNNVYVVKITGNNLLNINKLLIQ